MTIKIDNKIKTVIVIPTYKKGKSIEFFSKNNKDIIKEAKDFGFESENAQTCMIKVKGKKILLVGVKEKYNLEELRNAYSSVFSHLKSKKEKEAQVNIPKENKEEIIAVVEGLDLTNYSFDKYMSKKDNHTVNLFLNINPKNASLINKTLKVNDNVKIVRNMVNENADIITPKKLEMIAKEFAKKNKLKITVINEKQMIKEKLNLIYNVGKSAVIPPRLIIVEYTPIKSKEKLAIVGKGLTFDSGGLNLKPTNYIETMKLDMGGAATAFGAFKSAVELKIKKNLLLVMGCAENAIDAKSYKPGDVLKSYNGKSVEIGNTDAEGRLVLADSIAYVQKKFKPTSIIDLATLTGACLVALGPSLIAIMGNNDKMKKSLFKSGEDTGDKAWELPIYEEHREMIKSKIADLKNLGGRYGGTITAGAFIEAFVEKDVKWVHLDIAGAAFSEGPRQEKYVPSFGGTGTGVRLLVNYIENN